MHNFRFTALEKTLERKAIPYEMPKNKPSEYFGEMTFNLSAMKEYLTTEAFKRVRQAVEKGEKIDRRVADQIAASMKAWAIAKGATHYTHWFHPLRGTTAEKHNTFIQKLDSFHVIERFSEKELIQGEPDASSFPSALRADADNYARTESGPYRMMNP